MSILRAPKSPDDQCDIGQQTFKYALYPHAGTFADSDVVQAGYEFNIPLMQFPHEPKFDYGGPFFETNCKNVVIDSIKRAEQSTSETALILRMFESYGGRGIVKISR